QCERDRVELPALFKAVARARFEQKTERADHEVQHDQFGDPDPRALLRGFQRHGGEEALVQEREVGADQRQQHDKPARCRHQSSSVCWIACRQAFNSGSGTIPSTSTATPLSASKARVLVSATIGDLSCGSSKYISLTMRR